MRNTYVMHVYIGALLHITNVQRVWNIIYYNILKSQIILENSSMSAWII